MRSPLDKMKALAMEMLNNRLETSTAEEKAPIMMQMNAVEAMHHEESIIIEHEDPDRWVNGPRQAANDTQLVINLLLIIKYDFVADADAER